MKRAASRNINTAAYWDGVYAGEGARAQRVDPIRLGTLERWVGVLEEEKQSPARVLDVGCGRGRALFGLWAAKRDRTLAGLDISEVAVEAARAQRHSLGAHSVIFESRDADAGLGALPFEPFDVVWCGETLEHVDRPDALISAMAGVLCDGGFLVLSTPFKGRNRSDEHVFEFGPADIATWAARVGELVFLDCMLLPSWLTMFAVIRKGERT